MRKLEQVNCDKLEAMIDATSLSIVLNAISIICCNKAEHLQANWQEGEQSPLVKFWAINSKCFNDHRERVLRDERMLGIQAS